MDSRQYRAKLLHTFNLLDMYEVESVETIFYDYFVYLLGYKYISDDKVYPQPICYMYDYYETTYDSE